MTLATSEITSVTTCVEFWWHFDLLHTGRSPRALKCPYPTTGFVKCPPDTGRWTYLWVPTGLSAD